MFWLCSAVRTCITVAACLLHWRFTLIPALPHFWADIQLQLNARRWWINTWISGYSFNSSVPCDGNRTPNQGREALTLIQSGSKGLVAARFRWSVPYLCCLNLITCWLPWSATVLVKSPLLVKLTATPSWFHKWLVKFNFQDMWLVQFNLSSIMRFYPKIKCPTIPWCITIHPFSFVFCYGVNWICRLGSHSIPMFVG